jgi:hypothetical protein
MPRSTDKRPHSPGGRTVLVVLALLAVAVAVPAFAAHNHGHAGAGSTTRTVTVADAAASGCAPAVLNRSDILPGTSLAVSPLPDSRSASPRTQISMLGVRSSSLERVSVSGSRSGRHAGSLRAYSQGDGASFVPATPFRAGETGTVRGDLREPSRTTAFAYHFAVAQPDAIQIQPTKPPPADPAGVATYRSEPTLHPPVASITRSTPAAAPGDLLAAVYGSGETGGPVIFDDAGQVVWFKPLPVGQSAANLQVQTDAGRPVLTWWRGVDLPEGFGLGDEVIMDSSYRQVQVVHAGNGYQADLHDFVIERNGTALLTAFAPIDCDLSSIGQSRRGYLTDAVYQDVDLKTGLVRREWHAVDHVRVADSRQSDSYITSNYPFDFFHINSLDPESHDRLLMSARNTWALYTLDRRTGQILATIGGRGSSFAMGPSSQTAFQHDATALPDGTVSVFDNGGKPVVHATRAVLLRVDPSARKVTLARQLIHAPAVVAGSQGNVQLLRNGDLFVGWGGAPSFSEYAPNGTLVFDGSVSHTAQSYRVYRFPWTGAPTTPPAVATTLTGGHVTVYASWNGATGVDRWRVLAGATASALAPVATAKRTGFETAIVTSSAGPVVQVQALDAAARVLASSRVTSG